MVETIIVVQWHNLTDKTHESTVWARKNTGPVLLLQIILCIFLIFLQWSKMVILK